MEIGKGTAASRGQTPRSPPNYSENASERARRRLQQRLEIPHATSTTSQKTAGSKKTSSSTEQKAAESGVFLSAALIHKEESSDLLTARKCSSTASTLIRLLSETPAAISVHGSLATIIARKVTDLVAIPGVKSAEDEVMAGLSRHRRYEMSLSQCLDDLEATIMALESACSPARPPSPDLPPPRFASLTPSQALLSPVRDRASSPPRRQFKRQVFSASASPSGTAFGVDSFEAVEEHVRSIASALTAATALASTEAKDKKMNHLWSQAVSAVSSVEQMQEKMDAMKAELDKTKRKCKELEETLLKSRVSEKAQKGKREQEVQQLRLQHEDTKRENHDLQEELERLGFQLVSSQIAASSKHVVEARIRQCEDTMADMEQQRRQDLVLASARTESLEELDRTLVLRGSELRALRGQVEGLSSEARAAKEEAERAAALLQRMAAIVGESAACGRAAAAEVALAWEAVADRELALDKARAMLQAHSLHTAAFANLHAADRHVTISTAVRRTSADPYYASAEDFEVESPLHQHAAAGSDSHPTQLGIALRGPGLAATHSAGGATGERHSKGKQLRGQSALQDPPQVPASQDGNDGDGTGAMAESPAAAGKEAGGDGEEKDSEASPASPPDSGMPEWLAEKIAERVRRCSGEAVPLSDTAARDLAKALRSPSAGEGAAHEGAPGAASQPRGANPAREAEKQAKSEIARTMLGSSSPQHAQVPAPSPGPTAPQTPVSVTKPPSASKSSLPRFVSR